METKNKKMFYIYLLKYRTFFYYPKEKMECNFFPSIYLLMLVKQQHE